MLKTATRSVVITSCIIQKKFFRSQKLSLLPIFTPALYHPPYGLHRFMSEAYPTEYGNNKAETSIFEVLAHGSMTELKDVLHDHCDPNIRNADLRTPLMIAAENGKCDMMAALIENGAKLNLQDIYGETALMLAARENHKEAVSLLLHAGAQPDIHNYEDMTAADTTLDNDIDANIRTSHDPERDPSFFR